MRPCDIESDSPDDRIIRETIPGQTRPGFPRIRGSPQAAARPAAVEPPWCPAPLIRSRDQNIRIRRIEHDIGEAGVLVDEPGIRPGPAAIGRLVESAFGVRPEQVTGRGDVDDVRILRADDNTRDCLCVFEPRRLERSSCVSRLVNACAE